MSDPYLIFTRVCFSYDASPERVLDDVSFHLERGWTGVVGANGAGKTTLLQLAGGGLAPESGSVERRGLAVYCPQRTDFPPERLYEFLSGQDREALTLRAQLEVEADYLDRWETLSHGERKRAQIGTALWQEPQILLVDEPTNHIDGNGKKILLQALKSFGGVGLLVCHDRDWLDGLCVQCLFCAPPNAALRPGNYSEAAAQYEIEKESALRQSETAKRELKRLRREVQRRSAEASGADRKRSKRGLGKGDSDGRAKINLARVSGKDGQAGRLKSQLDGRLTSAKRKADKARTDKTYEMGIWMPGECSKRDVLFRLEPGEIPLGEGRALAIPRLVMQPTDRVALVGPNGAGKSSLLNKVVRSLLIPSERVVYLPQEIGAAECGKILREAKESPPAVLGQIMTIVRRLGSDPKMLLASVTPSPGETRKLLLAKGISRVPHLIIMDEPTNHLDLPSVECLEDALQDCPCGLLLVSHDERFSKRTTTKRWRCADDKLLVE